MTPSILKYYLALIEVLGYDLYYDSDLNRWEAYASEDQPIFWDTSKEQLIISTTHELYENC
jgi:hypothetical protein